MKFINNDFSFDPKQNLALEEALFKTYNFDEPILYLWQNDKSVIIGKHQILENEVNLKLCRDNSVEIVRRNSGGGAVFHDLGNINFSIITNKNDTNDYLKPIINTLEEFGLQAKINGRNDLVLEDRKFSGMAFYTKKEKVLVHGTLLFDVDLNLMSEVLTPNKSKLSKHFVKSTESRVINLKTNLKENISLEKFRETLTKHYDLIYRLEPIDIDLELKETWDNLFLIKYGTDTWNNMYSNSIKKILDFRNGIITVFYDYKDNRFSNITFNGDFFSSEDIRELESFLNNSTIEEIKEQIEKLDLNKYITGIEKKEFLDLFTI